MNSFSPSFSCKQAGRCAFLSLMKDLCSHTMVCSFECFTTAEELEKSLVVVICGEENIAQTDWAFISQTFGLCRYLPSNVGAVARSTVYYSKIMNVRMAFGAQHHSKTFYCLSFLFCFASVLTRHSRIEFFLPLPHHDMPFGNNLVVQCILELYSPRGKVVQTRVIDPLPAETS